MIDDLISVMVCVAYGYILMEALKTLVKMVCLLIDLSFRTDLLRKCLDFFDGA